MRRIVIAIVLLLARPVAGEALSKGQKPGETYDDTSNLLLKMQSSATYDGTLGVLFAVGDERIHDLIRALSDPREGIRQNAQRVIRYLGNEIGMRALVEQYKKSDVYGLTGPVPLPLSDWDYEYLRRNYLGNSARWDQRSASYIYALALDESPQALALLSELILKAKEGSIPYHYALTQVEGVRSNGLLLSGDLKNSVRENAFFLGADERQYSVARTIAVSHSQDKTLIEVDGFAGALRAERYHVVLQRCGESWRFYSITRISVS